MASDECVGDTVRRECPMESCDWHIEVSKIAKDDKMARLDAESQAESHFARYHRGKARIRVVLERQVTVHPEQSLTEIIDSHHEKISDSCREGYEVAYAVGEFIEEPDRDCVQPRSDRNGGGE